MATTDQAGSVPRHDHTEPRDHGNDTIQATGENVAAETLSPVESVEAGKEIATTDVEAAAADPPKPPIHSMFPKNTRVLIVVMTTMASFFSPVSGQIYLPALNTLASEFHVSLADINLTVTSYMIFQGIAPMFFGDMADQIGKRPTYICCFTIYFFANLGLALQRNYAALLVLRAMQSSGSSGVIALGNGVISDVTTSAERGSYVAWVQLGTQLGPALGPILGGILSQFLGWPSIFWFLLISGGIYLILYIMLIPETGRNVVGDGSLPPQGWNMSLLNIMAERKRKKNGLERTASHQAKHEESKRLAAGRHLRFPNPFQALRIVVQKDVSLILLSLSLLMTGFFCMIVPMPSIFASTYGYNDLQIGLCYLPFSAGAMLGSLACGRFLDRNFHRIAAKHGITVDRKRASSMREFPIENARLEIIWAPLIIGSLSTLVWGWVLRAQTSLAAPLVILFIGGAMLSGAMSMLMTLLVDLYPQRASTAMAGLNLCRCFMSAAGTASIEYIIDAWGLGWTYTFLGLLMLVGSVPPLMVVVWRGPGWREERHLKEEKKEESKKAEEEQKRADEGDRVGGGEERAREEEEEEGASTAEEEKETETEVGPQQNGGGLESDKRE